MKVLLYHMRYEPDATGTAPLVTQLAQDLAAKKIDVVVVTSLPHYGRNSVHPDFREYDGFFHHSLVSGVQIIRTPVFVPPRPSVLLRALNYLSYNLFSIFAGLFVRNVDVVLAVNPPITTTFSAWLISLIHRSPLIVGIQDVWPDCVIQVGEISNRVVIGISKFLEIFQYRIARKIIVLSDGMKMNLLGKGVNQDKIAVVANWSDLNEVVPLPKENDFYIEHGLNDHFTVLFSGNHGYIAALESVIKAAELLTQTKEILFLLVGEGSVKPDLMEYAREKGLTNIRFLPTQSKDRWLEMLAAVDLGLVTLNKDLAGLNVPSKLYTLMAASCPIMASVPENSEIARIIQEANCGINTPPEDPVSLAQAILDCYNNVESIKDMGHNGREYLIKNQDRSTQTDLYYEVILDVIGKESKIETIT